MSSIKEEGLTKIAKELLDTYGDGWGIQAQAVRTACANYQVEFSDLFVEICNEAHRRELNYDLEEEDSDLP